MEEIFLSDAEFARQSLQNFWRRFPDEEACLQVFPFVCRACGFGNDQDDAKSRVVVCSKCNVKTWRTAGTYFHGLKRLLPTFALIWLHEDRAILSIKKFAEELNICYSTAWETDAKLKDVLEQEMNKHDAFEVISKFFDGVIFKRSDQTWPGKHPSYEEEEEGSEPIEPEDMDADQKTIYALLSSQPIEFEVLYQKSGLTIDKFSSALAMLDMNEVAERHIGDKFSLKKTNPVVVIGAAETQTICDFFEYISNFHGVSRKYLQRYIACFWSHWGVNRWCRQTLLITCMKYGRLSRDALLAYVSPKLVRVPCRY